MNSISYFTLLAFYSDLIEADGNADLSSLTYMLLVDRYDEEYSSDKQEYDNESIYQGDSGTFIFSDEMFEFNSESNISIEDKTTELYISPAFDCYSEDFSDQQLNALVPSWSQDDFGPLVGMERIGKFTIPSNDFPLGKPRKTNPFWQKKQKEWKPRKWGKVFTPKDYFEGVNRQVPGCQIDKVSLGLRADLFQDATEAAWATQSSPLLFLRHGAYVEIIIQAELFDERPAINTIREEFIKNVLPWFSAHGMEEFKMCYLLDNEMHNEFFIELLESLGVKLVCLELAWDFKTETHPLRPLNRNDRSLSRFIKGTFYSPDSRSDYRIRSTPSGPVKELKGKKRSLLAVYNRGYKVKSTEPIMRIEFRIEKNNLRYFPLSILCLSTSEIISVSESGLVALLKRAISTEAWEFDYNLLASSHKNLLSILYLAGCQADYTR